MVSRVSGDLENWIRLAIERGEKDFGYSVKELANGAARAAIMAMREPTEAMLKAGDNHKGYWDDESPASIYGRMIDAALSESQT